MRGERRRMLCGFVLLANLGLVPPVSAAPLDVVLKAADGVKVFAQSYPAPAANAPVIPLFHQAGSNKSEYAPIAPELVRLGFNALAVDQRSGGDLYQPPNQTVATLGHSTSYQDVLPDMEAALAWAKRSHPHVPIYVWGSSYSAALAFPFAAAHPHDVSAVIAFSPGEYLDDKSEVERAARRVTVPVFVDSASNPLEIENARDIYNASASKHKVDYVPKHGIHGSSTLRSDRDPEGAAENWRAVTAFLKTLPGAAP
jgi:alpha-beta hydrolase superfamily lysophospholipase